MADLRLQHLSYYTGTADQLLREVSENPPMPKETGCLVRSGHASAGRELGLREQRVGGQNWMRAVEEALVSVMVLEPNLNVALSRGLSPEAQPTRICLQLPSRLQA